jgi:hypothetical protein
LKKTAAIRRFTDRSRKSQQAAEKVFCVVRQAHPEQRKIKDLKACSVRPELAKG